MQVLVLDGTYHRGLRENIIDIKGHIAARGIVHHHAILRLALRSLHETGWVARLSDAHHLHIRTYDIELRRT